MTQKHLVKNKIWLLIFSTFLLCGCSTVYNPVTGKKEIIFINSNQESALGNDIDKQLQAKLKISKEPRFTSRLDRVFPKVAAASDRQDIKYNYRVVVDPELNAFAVPGGFIYVNSGLTEAATDQELACVLAHEIGHVAARHSIKHLQAELGYQMLIGIITGVTGEESINQATDIVFNLSALGYSRSDENQADLLGVRYAKRSGFDPRAMVSFFKKLKVEQQKKGQNTRIEMLSSHPDLDKRIKNVESEIAARQ